MILSRFVSNNHVLINLCLLAVVVIGVTSWQRLPQEMFPAVQLDLVKVGTIYEGATPGEVQQQITVVMEKLFDNNRDIDYVSSLSEEGLSQVYLHLNDGVDLDRFIDDARTLVESAITDMPQNAERPQLSRIRTQFPVISVSLYGEVSDVRLQQAAKDMQRQLLTVPGVANAAISGGREKEIHIAVDPYRLASLGIGLAEIEAAVRNNLRDRPGGSISGGGREIRLRGRGESPDPETIGAIPVRAGAGDRVLALGDVADVSLRLEEALTYARFNGKPSINIIVTKSEQASTVEVARLVRELIAETSAQLPRNMGVGLHSDLSKYVKVRLNTVRSSGLFGLLLLGLSLYLLLNWRVAAVTAMGIPVSFLVAVIGMYYLGYTINMVSLFAFLVVLGMIVDDAIIVTENVYRHMEQGASSEDAIRRGLGEVIAPVTTATLTTIAAFMPIFAVGGTLGLFIEVIPVVVSLCLIGSMLEAFLILPSHIQLLVRPRRPKAMPGASWVKGRALSVFRWCTRFRYVTLSASCCLLLLSMVYANTRLPFQLFGDVDIGQFIVNVEAPNTYSVEDSKLLARQVEQAISGVLQEGEAVGIVGNVGVSFIDFQRFVRGSNLLQFVVDLETPAPTGFVERWISPLVSMDWDGAKGRRERDSDVIVDQVREVVASLPGVIRTKIERPEAGPEGSDIDIGLHGEEPLKLRQQAEDIANFLRATPGVKDVQHDQEPGKPEFHYSLNDRGRKLGLDQETIAAAVQSGYLGRKLAYANVDNERIPVRLIYDERIREDHESFATMPIVTAGGEAVRLGDVADISARSGVDRLRRRDGSSLARITAAVDSDITTPRAVSSMIQREFIEGQGMRLSFLGEKKKAEEAFADFHLALLIALMSILLILVALFRTLIDPMLIIMTLPFGVIGIVFGHAVFGHHLQFLSITGALALCGIIVNDSLILMVAARRNQAEGMDLPEALELAARQRARPIYLTTVTTFLGVSPMIFFATGQTAFLAPMAISLGFGLVFATVMILVNLPAMCLIAADARNLALRLLR